MSEAELTQAYLRQIQKLQEGLEPGWRVEARPTGKLTWQTFEWEPETLPTQGWKIHISAAAVEAVELCARVLPRLIQEQATFKLPATVEGIAFLNSGEGGETQTGKIVTVYPRTVEQAARLIRQLDRAWPQSHGPAVPSDLAVRPGGAIYFRYGSFGNGETMADAFGRQGYALRRPDGSLITDQRSADGAQPAWVPAAPARHRPARQANAEGTLDVRGHKYLQLALLHTSSKSKVWLGLDLQSSQTVILKTARAGVYGDLRGFEARDWLANEHAILKLLAGEAGLAPRPLEFAEGDPAILILDDFEGAFLDTLPAPERIQALPALAQALARLHTLGIAHRDVKLANALWEAGAVRLIDFEIAAPVGASQTIPGGTPGHTPPEGSDAPSSTAGDVYALGACVAHAILGYDPGLLPNPGGRLVGLLHLAGSSVGAGIARDLLHSRPECRPSMTEAAARLIKAGAALAAAPRPVQFRSANANRRWSQQAALEAGLATRRYLLTGGAGHAWRNYHVQADFICEGLNLGAAGIILGLASISQALGLTTFDHDIRAGSDWLSARPPADASHGLFTGNAGVALALAVASKRCRRPELIEPLRTRLLAATTPSRDFDLFAGAAGVLFAGCLIAEVLGETWPLEAVQPKAQELLKNVDWQAGVAVWAPSGELDGVVTPYTGAAHGSAGIALALSVWGRRVNHREALELAEQTYRSLYTHGRTADGASLKLTVESEAAPAPTSNWCHGAAGYLWCLLQSGHDSSALREPLDWAVDIFSSSLPVGNPTYCHGLAGQLELWRMLSAIPRHQELATHRAATVAQALRLLQVRSAGHSVWCSENPALITPDLWVGFLGPATALALYACDSKAPLLSLEWLTV